MLRHALPVILESVVAPVAAYYLVLAVAGFRGALLGALVGRPFTQRFLHDFCPLRPELLARTSVHRFFVRVSFLWAVAMFLNGAVVLTLLLTASDSSFPLERLGASLSLTAGAIALSNTWFTRSMRNDGVTVRFGHARPGRPAPEA